jgi:hypothetical protein
MNFKRKKLEIERKGKKDVLLKRNPPPHTSLQKLLYMKWEKAKV